MVRRRRPLFIDRRRRRCGRDHHQRRRRPDRSGREWGPPPVPPGQADQGRDHRRRRPEQGDRRQVRHGQRQGADGRRRRHPARLPRPHRLGHRRDPQRDHVRPAAQAHGLDQRGLPRRRRRSWATPSRPTRTSSTSPATAAHRRCIALQQPRATPSWPTTSSGRPDRQDVHDQPEGVRRVRVRRRRRRDSIITFSSATCTCAPGSWRKPSGRPRRVPSYILGGDVRQRSGCTAATRPTPTTPTSCRRCSTRSTATATSIGHDPAHQGGDVWAADAAIEIMRNDDELERHLRDAARRRQGRPHVGRRRTTPARPAPTATR